MQRLRRDSCLTGTANLDIRHRQFGHSSLALSSHGFLRFWAFHICQLQLPAPTLVQPHCFHLKWDRLNRFWTFVLCCLMEKRRLDSTRLQALHGNLRRTSKTWVSAVVTHWKNAHIATLATTCNNQFCREQTLGFDTELVMEGGGREAQRCKKRKN